MLSSYQAQFPDRQDVTKQADEPANESTPGIKKQKYTGKTVHARDWRRLEVLSPTYAATHFKIVDQMTEPSVPVSCQKIVHPTVKYDTAAHRTMEARRSELEDINCSNKKAIMTNRLSIWGKVDNEETNKYKTSTSGMRTASQIRVGA